MSHYDLAIRVAEEVRAAGGRAFFVGGYVRDHLLGIPSEDMDIEVYGLAPARLREALLALGEVDDSGAAFGVLKVKGSDLDIAMPRRETRTGARHTDFAVTVDPFLSYEDASRRRDFTVNAMLMDPLTGEIVDCWGGKRDLEQKIVRHVCAERFPEDALRLFRGAQFAARLGGRMAEETLALCRGMDVTALSGQRVYSELTKALLKAEKPSIFFETLLAAGHLSEFFPEVEVLLRVEQNPQYHPEGNVFLHTMLVLDAAARLRAQAREPLNFLLSALMHDLGKANATEIINGRITSHMHHETGVPLSADLLTRLAANSRTLAYVQNMVRLHMRPNMLAAANSKKRKTRVLFDESVCPEDLILLARADAEGTKGMEYDPASTCFLLERLADYRDCLTRPMVTGKDLLDAGYRPGTQMRTLLARARTLHFSGMEKKRILSQLKGEFPPEGNTHE